uniref:J domain-containing protein n=1 Tax=Globodera rostochiensis TaxID=31243 RepID=A0A914HMY1_GLORO
MFDRCKNFLVAGNEVSYYEVLGVNKRATTDEINKKYKKIMLEFHTDKNPDGAVMSQVFSKAKETLTDPRKRAIYDGQRGYSSYSSSSSAAGGSQHSWWTGAANMDYEMSKPPEFPTFTAMLKESNCEQMANQLKELADYVVADGDPPAGKLFVGNGHHRAPALRYIPSSNRDNFCLVCGTKGMPLDNVCYCIAAKANCHCYPKCCRTTLKDRGKLY